MLPPELIDHIFSFLRGDIPALKACSRAHSLFSKLAEQHLYTDIIVRRKHHPPPITHSFSDLYQQFSKNPCLLYYPRTLEIDTSLAGVVEPLSFNSMVPRMINLVSLKICGETNIKLPTIRDSLQQLSIEELDLCNFYDFPLSVLDNGKTIKKLTLSVRNARQSSNPYQTQARTSNRLKHS